MIRKSRGALLIEIIIALSVFAMTAAMVTRTFLTGLELQKVSTGNPNEAIIKTTLINRIKLENIADHSKKIELPLYFGDNKNDKNISETWNLEVVSSQKINPCNGDNETTKASALTSTEGLYRVNVKIWEGKDDKDSQEYEIFRYLKA